MIYYLNLHFLFSKLEIILNYIKQTTKTNLNYQYTTYYLNFFLEYLLASKKKFFYIVIFFNNLLMLGY